ncbi:MAG TPA: hypothetical protein VFD63_25915 [Pyrinomonadaceae bacterium]|jgi:hypothetical protein|nr:hypothetical protein [Pyrinomonadaceae bacterium]
MKAVRALARQLLYGEGQSNSCAISTQLKSSISWVESAFSAGFQFYPASEVNL